MSQPEEDPPVPRRDIRASLSAMMVQGVPFGVRPPPRGKPARPSVTDPPPPVQDPTPVLPDQPQEVKAQPTQQDQQDPLMDRPIIKANRQRKSVTKPNFPPQDPSAPPVDVQDQVLADYATRDNAQPDPLMDSPAVNEEGQPWLADSKDIKVLEGPAQPPQRKSLTKAVEFSGAKDEKEVDMSHIDVLMGRPIIRTNRQRKSVARPSMLKTMAIDQEAKENIDAKEGNLVFVVLDGNVSKQEDNGPSVEKGAIKEPDIPKLEGTKDAPPVGDEILAALRLDARRELVHVHQGDAADAHPVDFLPEKRVDDVLAALQLDAQLIQVHQGDAADAQSDKRVEEMLSALQLDARSEVVHVHQGDAADADEDVKQPDSVQVLEGDKLTVNAQQPPRVNGGDEVLVQSPQDQVIHEKKAALEEAEVPKNPPTPKVQVHQGPVVPEKKASNVEPELPSGAQKPKDRVASPRDGKRIKGMGRKASAEAIESEKKLRDAFVAVSEDKDEEIRVKIAVKGNPAASDNSWIKVAKVDVENDELNQSGSGKTVNVEVEAPVVQNLDVAKNEDLNFQFEVSFSSKADFKRIREERARRVLEDLHELEDVDGSDEDPLSLTQQLKDTIQDKQEKKPSAETSKEGCQIS